MKRIITLLLPVFMLLTLVACGGGNTNTGTATTGGETTTTTETTGGEAGGENTLTVWCWDPAFNIYSMKEAEKLYQKDHPDFVLNVIETPWDDVQTKVITAGTSGDTSTLPDILLMQDNAFQKNVISYPELWIDVDGSGINFGDFAASKVAYSVVDGKHYGVPFDNGAVIAAYRTDVLEEAGYTIDDFKDITWDEWITKGTDVLNKTGHPLLSCVSNEVDVVMMMLQSAGSSLFDENGNPNIADNEVLKTVLETYKKARESGVLVERNNWDEYIGSFISGEVAGTINGCWIMGSIQTAADQSGKWALTNMPKLDGVNNATNYSNNGGSSWLLTSNTKNKELAYDFMKSTFGSSVEFYETILPSAGALSCYAPAGKSSVYSEPLEFFGGQPVYKDVVDFSTKTPSNNTGVYYYEARAAIATAAQKFYQGSDLATVLQDAQAEVEFQMGQ